MGSRMRAVMFIRGGLAEIFVIVLRAFIVYIFKTPLDRNR